LNIRALSSLAELRSLAPAWDDLWWRSEATLPTARAELIAQWVERFAPAAGFRALVVEDQGQWVAALPMVERRVARLLTAGTLPSNLWSPGGTLLWDASLAAEQSIADRLVEAMRRLPWQVLWLEEALWERAAWQTLIAAVRAAGMAMDCRSRWQVARIPIDHDWATCRGRWSRKHRQKMNSSLRRLSNRGSVRLRLHADFSGGELEPLLRRAFAVEDGGWKGRSGTSVLRSPGILDFFLRQSRQLAQWGHLELAFLECGGQAVAFCYGLTAKGVFHSLKIGYDPAYADCAPGQLLRHFLLERFHGDLDRTALDCTGPMTEAHQHWRPESYTMGRLLIAPRRWLGRAVVAAYQSWKPQPLGEETPAGWADRKSGLSREIVLNQ
jgi:CelD/BcsL family acetyltransferase involved in cellulose biosynthesis